MKSILKKIATVFCTVLALGMISCQQAVEHVHTFDSEWTTDSTSHWKKATCEHTDEVKDKADHIFTEWKETLAPTEEDDGSKERNCKVCGYIETEVIAALGHTHKFLTTWSSDDTYHWHEADCRRDGHIADKATHTFIYKGNCWQECECGGKNAVSLDTLGAYKFTDEKYTFGVYPQTIKASSVTVDKTVKNTEITGADYYLGSDGAWYAECVENAYDTGDQYKYSDGNTVAKKSANSVKYFKVEPIQWVYLAETKCLHAKKILTADVQWHAYSNNYKNSNIRSWLNGTFYDSAFTESQKEKIKTTTVDNSASSTTDAGNNLTQATDYACRDTLDKIFLLSEKEATTTGNGFTAYDASGAGNSRIRFPTDYALANYCYKYSDSSYGGWWWLRSPNRINSAGARGINDDGNARSSHNVDTMDVGVVPALSISE